MEDYSREKINKIQDYSSRIQIWINIIQDHAETQKLASRLHRFRGDLASYLDVLKDISDNLKLYFIYEEYEECESMIDWAKKTLYLIFVDSHKKDWYIKQTAQGRLIGAQKILEIINSFPGDLEDKILSIGKKTKYIDFIDWSVTYGHFNYLRLLSEACSSASDPGQIKFIEWMLGTYMLEEPQIDVDEYDTAILEDRDLAGEYRNKFIPLKEACKAGNRELVELLLNKVYSGPGLRKKPFILLLLKVEKYIFPISSTVRNHFEI